MTNDVVQATRLTFDPGSPNCGVLRGGPLEPGALACSDNSQAKSAAYSAASFPAPAAQRNLSLLGGASQSVFAFQAGHHLFSGVERVLKRRRRSFRIALATAAMRLKTLSSHASGRGPTHHRSGARRRASTRSRTARRTPLRQGTCVYVSRSASFVCGCYRVAR
jgi:hypothetical protein